MPTEDEARAVAADARMRAEDDLLGRGYEPARYERLLAALEHGIAQVIVARSAGVDVEAYELFAAGVTLRLAESPPRSELPRPPRHTLNLRLLDPEWRPPAA